MVSYVQLMEFNPEALRAAARQWQTVASELTDQRIALRTAVEHQLVAPVWEGVAAAAARGHVAALGAGADDLVGVFERVSTTLSTAADQLSLARARVDDLAAAARRCGLRVGPDGSVTVPAGAVPDGPDQATRLAALTDAATEYTAAINAQLQAASTVDAQTAATLAGGDANAAWSGASTSDTTGSAEADARRAAEIAAGGLWDTAQLDELSTLFASYAGDPAFAATFFAELGPQGTLDFLGQVTSMGFYEHTATSDLGTQIGDLQRQVGGMLALATDPASEPTLGTGWTEQLLAAASTPVDVSGTQPSGLQLLGVLLHNDQVVFPTDFLTRYGDAVMAQDPAGWPTDSLYRLSFIDQASTGWDPMTGLLSALGTNGEASTAFFDPAAHPGRIEYLLEDRLPVAWDDPDDPYNEDEHGPYVDELGNALNSATTTDIDATGAHSAAQASIMTETVRVLGSPEHLNGDVPDGIRDSLGTMFAEYIGDVNHAMENRSSGGSLQFDADGNPVALSHEWSGLGGPGSADPRFAAESHALFAADDLARVLADTAHDPQAYAQIYEAERAYTALTLDVAASAEGLDLQERANAVESEAQNSATVLGVLDEARADVIQQEGEAADEAYNNAVDSVGGATGWALGKAADLAGDNPVGTIIGGVSTALDWILGQADRDSSEAIARETAELYHNGRWQAANLAFQAMWNNQIWPPEYPPPDILLDDNGQPIDLTTIDTEEEWAALNEWTSSIGYDAYMGNVIQDVDNSYSTGENRENESDGDRTD